jgi:hypothetical protein
MDEENSPIKSSMPETDQNAGEQLTEHSMVLGRKFKRKEGGEGKRKLYARTYLE